MADTMPREAKSVEPIALTAGKISGDLAQTIMDLQSIVELQRSAITEHAHTTPVIDNRAMALQSAALTLQKHASHLREMVDPVRSVLRPERFYQAGIVAAADERFEIAAGFFHRALELRAEYPEAHKGLGDALRKLGAHEDAIKHYQQAAEIQASLAHTLETQGKFAESVRGYRTAGADFIEQGRYDEAANTFRKAIRLDCRDAKSHLGLGDALYRKLEYGAAEAAFRTAIDLDPTYAEAYSGLARLLIHLNRQDEALSLLSTSAGVNQDHIDLGGAVKMPPVVTFISYAQAKEDIHLFKALFGVHHEVGFYIDVGAWHPEIDSVTKLFYDRGWHGINVEPSPKWFARLVEQRPRDINLQVAVSETPGEITYFEHPDGSLGTTVETIADLHEAHGRLQKKSFKVKTLTLTQICDEHALHDIHFLKIDVEGAEGSVLRSMDFQKYRPWLLCIESHLPMRPDVQTYGEWENYLLDSGYQFVFTDSINRYYVAQEHRERAASFAYPSDFLVHINDVRYVKKLEERIRSLESRSL
jgi:FkbM family methyltransferase